MPVSRPSCLLSILTAAFLLSAGALAYAQARSPQPRRPATQPGKTGAPYEPDPGKYVEEPTKNMGAGAAPTASRPAPKSGSGGGANEAGLQKILAKIPKGMRHEFVMMPMRDGVKLATDLFLPPEGEGPWPAVLLRTQYSRWDERGFRDMGAIPSVMVLQNVRGTYGSEGAGTFDNRSFESDQNDGYDTVEWLAKQKWSSGKIGMWGPSGHGIAALNAMWSLAPHLTAIDVNVTCDNPNLYFVFDNGARRFLYSWLAQRGLKTSGKEWPRPTVHPYSPQAYYDFIKERAPKVTASYRMNAGWFDVFSEAALDHFAVLAPYGKAYVRVGPSGHGAIGGELVYKARNQFPMEAMKADRPLKDALTKEPPKESKSLLVYYLMGDTKDASAPGNVYMVSGKWPVDHTPTPYYMGKDGTLSLEAPKEKDASLAYDYDPKNPVPTTGGNYDVSDPKRMQIGPLDQRPLKDRKDILRFTTAPLAEPVGITGKVWVELHVSSDCTDTMFTANLVDVYPDGYEAVMRQSAMLARYSQGLDKPAPLEKGKVYKLSMDCWSTALVFNKGHRIAVHVSSSSDPGYEVHPNTYEPARSIEQAKVAHNTVHLSADRASKLILPVVAKETYLNVGAQPRR